MGRKNRIVELQKLLYDPDLGNKTDEHRYAIIYIVVEDLVKNQAIRSSLRQYFAKDHIKLPTQLQLFKWSARQGTDEFNKYYGVGLAQFFLLYVASRTL